MLKHIALAGALTLALVSSAWAQIGPGKITTNVTGTGNDIVFIGDSLTDAGCSSIIPPFVQSAGYFIGGSGQCYPSWVNDISRGALVWSPTAGYTGNYFGIQAVYVTQGLGGTCTPNTTVTFSSTGGTTNTSPISFLVSSSGSISGKVIPASQGSGYTSGQTWTQTGGVACSVAPTFTNIYTGSGTFGIGGETTIDVITRIPDWTATHHSFCVIEIGTNDVNASSPYLTIEANYTTILTAAKQVCGVVGLMSIPPRGPPNALSTSNEQTRLKINDWLQNQAKISQSTQPQPTQVVYIDVAQYWTDTTSATGAPLANVVLDGLHQSVSGAFYLGLAIVNSFRPYFHPAYAENQAQTDVYNSTFNPTGNLIGSFGLFLGTGGSVFAPVTGTAATGWSISRAAGAGTCSAVASLEARTDLPSGQRQLVTISCASGTATQEQIQLNLNSNVSTVSPGDIVTAHVEIDISNASNLSAIKSELFENNTVSQGALCTGDINSTNLLPSSASVATLIGGDALPNFGKTASGSFTWICDTPKITLQAGSPTLSIYIDLVGTDNTATFTVNARVANVSIRKYVVP